MTGPRNLMDRGHTIFAIGRLLDVLGFGNWTHTLLLWLGGYDGLEQHIPGENDPVLSVRDLLTRYTLRPRKVEIGLIAVDVVRLPFTHYRAAWVDERNDGQRDWDPLKEPWLDFVTHGEAGEKMRVWRFDEPYPPSDDVRRHLLAGYVRMNGLR